MSQAIANPSSEATNARFLLHLALWSGIYFTLVIAWGVRNTWPTELVGALLFFPLNLLLGWKLYWNNGWGLDTQDQPSEWELFITYFLLAIGVASGLLLLMAIGWICIGFAWMRPRRDTLNWREWFKLPLVFFFCLPILLDLAGSRHDWFHFFRGHSSNLSEFPHDLAMTRLHVLAGLAVLILASSLTGALFWISLPIVPLLLVANEYISQKLPSEWQNSEALTEFPRWLFVPLAAIAYALAVRFSLRRSLSSPRILHTLTPWMLSRSFSPWLASLVIFLQQASLVEGWLANNRSRLDMVGAISLLALLSGLRWRGTTDEVHSSSRISLAAALFVLLAAEWTDLDPLRHVSFGLLLIGLLSWRRTWPWSIFASAFFVWVTTLPTAFEVLANMGLQDTTALAWRLAGFFLGMVVLVAEIVRYRPRPALGTYDNYGWQPIKRLAFTLLVLVLAFQTASSFWPDSTGKISADIFREDGRLVSIPKSTRPNGVAEVRYWRSTKEGEDFNLLIARPANEPFLLEAPELILKEWGWRIVERRLIQHPTGQAVELEMLRGDQRGTALYWFEHGDRAFTNFLRGRQLLWSGWNLTRRDLRLILLYSEKERDPKRLRRFAESEEWFRQPSKPAE